MLQDSAAGGGRVRRDRVLVSRNAPSSKERKSLRPVFRNQEASGGDASGIPADEQELDTRGLRAQSVPSALSAWLRDAGQVPLLTPGEEIQLASQVKSGDGTARERMIRANLRLVARIARDYEHLGLPMVDLLSEGAIGLMKGVDRFDPTKGGKLSTYSAWWIRQQIRRAIANQSRTIRLPVHVEAKIYRLGLAELKLRELLGRDPTEEELGEELGIKAHRLARLRDAAMRQSSLDAPAGEDGQGAVGEVVADERAISPADIHQTQSDQELASKLLARLPEREAEILRCRFGLTGGEERTLEDLGRKFKLTRERIRQLQNEALQKLRGLMEGEMDLAA
jgi:RNA polymerase primary sigma factor